MTNTSNGALRFASEAEYVIISGIIFTIYLHSVNFCHSLHPSQLNLFLRRKQRLVLTADMVFTALEMGMYVCHTDTLV